ncbi:13975_t:CDS:2 [Acaulospora morrowiae]|uniref:13975_t:CDS:1 n=1 Tax=Acaulospora morrowiae TaxID=94023 RepID=A0A9N9BN51_9GLOM|nr:13975_t:CDS:2 [Acaulospora morrowiae]
MAEEEKTVTAITTDNTLAETTNTEEEKAQEEEPRCKVFVGNLAFQTSEQQLSDFFSKTGKVVNANIITRGTRSLGYGFVTLETEEDANKVVEELNKKDLDGRQINVEVAKPKTENTAPSNNYWNSGARRGRGRYGFRRGRGRGRARGRGRGRNGWQSRRRFGGRAGDESGDAHADNNESTTANATDAPTTNGSNAENESSRMFVANLPFSVDDNGLKEIFKDYDVVSAHVVRRRGGRSKGFGFVDLANEDEQTRALEGLKNVDSEGRELVIKVALSGHHIRSGGDAEKVEAPTTSADEKKEVAAASE